MITAARAAGVTVHHVSERVAKALSDSTTPQGVVAVVRGEARGLDDIADPSLVVLLDAVSDPGNAGTLVRTAAAAGADAVVFATGSVDPFSPKTLRAAAAATFAVPIVHDIDLPDAVGWAHSAGLAVVGTSMEGVPYYESDLTGAVALVAGNEAWGIGPAHADLLDATVGIPMPGPVESLNVAGALAIVIFEAVKQRRLSSATRRNGG